MLGRILTTETVEHIDYLAFGHVAADVGQAGIVLGGSVVYAAVTAMRLGRRAAIVTACEPGIDLAGVLPNTPVSYAPSLTSTVFENIYQSGRREQYLHGRAAGLQARDVPPHYWRKSRLVHIAPIAQEIHPSIVDTIDSGFIGLTAQGWLRGWDKTGKVHFKLREDVIPILPKLSAVVFSEDDVVGRADVIDRIAALAPVAAVTLGDKGARVHWAEGWHHFPAFPAREVDPTGAGDVFAAAFFHRLEQTGDPSSSAIFANCVAGFSVEAIGTAGIPTIDRVERRLRGAA